MKKSSLLITLLTLLPLAGCGQNDNSKTIYTSFYPVYDFTKRIVGDKFEVKNLTPVGTEPHDYEPKASEVAGMTSSKALFLNGLGLEHWKDELPSDLTKKSYVVTKDIETLSIDNVTDPHVWLSPKNAIKEMSNILATLKEIDVDNYKYYEDNYNKAVEDFNALDAEFKTTIDGLSNKYLVVSHAAFGYLCHEYGLTQIYVRGLTPDDEPTSKELEEIINQVNTYNVNTIFYEELVSPEISKKIADETGVKTETLNPLEGLEQEDLDAGEDYLSIMRDNLAKIKEANK